MYTIREVKARTMIASQTFPDNALPANQPPVAGHSGYVAVASPWMLAGE